MALNKVKRDFLTGLGNYGDHKTGSTDMVVREFDGAVAGGFARWMAIGS